MTNYPGRGNLAKSTIFAGANIKTKSGKLAPLLLHTPLTFTDVFSSNCTVPTRLM